MAQVAAAIDYIRENRDNFMLESKHTKICEPIVRKLDQVLVILERRIERRRAKTFANEALRLTKNAVDLWRPFYYKKRGDELEPSEISAFIKVFELIEKQFAELIRRETGIGPPIGEDHGRVVALEEDVQLVTSRLISRKMVHEMVAIVGRGGIGKTTLARKVYDSAVVRKSFDCHAWVTCPENLHRTNFQVNIAVQVMPSKKLKNAESMKKLLARFLESRRYLIVFDGIQTPQDWNIVQELLLAGCKGSRIITITSRRDIVHDGPDCFVLEKRPLSDEEGWELLNARVGFSIPTELEEIGRGIVMKCTGLPLAICKVGDELSKKEAAQDQWYMVLQQINQDQLLLYDSLDMAADALPFNFKQCLLYFGHFHEDYEVPVRRLIACWVAEGLLQKIIDVTETPEHAAEKLLMVLVQQNLIMVAKRKLNGKPKTCRMHYLLRDNWLSKAKEANSRPVNSKTVAYEPSRGKGMILRLADHLNKKDDSFPHIHGNNTISSSSFKKNYFDLCSFVSFDFREGPLPGEELGNFFRKCIAVGCFKKLRVVDLEGVFRPKLPDSIGKLTHLRYLGLRWTYLQTLPSSIGKLLNLQTLDLKRTYISNLPVSLWKMQQLRHLYLSEIFRCRFMPPPNNNTLIDIQTLWGAYVNEETAIKEGLDQLINLRKLGLAFRLTLLEQKALAKWITKLNHLESLRLRSLDHEAAQASDIYLEPLSDLKKLSSLYLFGRLANPIIMYNFPESLIEITLSVTGLMYDPMPNLEKLPDLRILRLFAGSYCGRKMVCSSGGFPFLRILKLWELEELEEWTVEEGTLPILREVEIRSCNKLEMIPDGMKHLLHCCELMITRMPAEFKTRISESQGQDWHKIAHVPSIIMKD
ncbi:unnamed protein product [Ilex paraguariensis]|uniref:Disease resistance protein n=1 Tax=Ilex paraguariensis TaxID=185542 RepID=A0ABC8U124_9AQUA